MQLYVPVHFIAMLDISNSYYSCLVVQCFYDVAKCVLGDAYTGSILVAIIL